MNFNIVGGLASEPAFSYGVVPSFCDPNVYPGQLGEGCKLGPDPPKYVTYPGGNTAWYNSVGSLIEASANPGQLGTTTGSVAIIDCVYFECAGVSCYDLACVQGGNTPSSGGYITESLLPPTHTPEPSALLLVCCGALFVVLRRSYVTRKRQQARAFAYGSLRT